MKFDIPMGTTVHELKNRITCDFPAVRQIMDVVVVSINREFAFDEDTIPDGAVVAIFPPVSGG